MIPENDATELLPDEPPKSGVWIDNCEVVGGDLTEEELAAGEEDGQTVNYDGWEAGNE